MPTKKVRPAQGSEEEESQRGYGENKAWACSLPRDPQRDAICADHADPGHRAPILHSSDCLSDGPRAEGASAAVRQLRAAGQQRVGVWPGHRCRSSRCCSSFSCKAGRAAAARTVLRDPSCLRPEPPCSTGDLSGCPERTDSWTCTSSQVLSQIAHPTVRLQVPQAETT